MPRKKEAPRLAVKERPIKGLIPYARNARTHSDEQISQIAASITEFGWTNPILVDGEGGIIAAETEGRVCYAMELGPEYVDVSIRWWQTLFDKEAIHEASGRSYNDMAAEKEAA